MGDHGIKKLPKDDEIGRLIKDYFLNQFCEEFVLVGREETCMPIYYEKFANAIKNFEVRDSDIFVCSYPKAGTTWTQEMIWLIMNNLDYEGANVPLGIRFPFLEYSTIRDAEKMDKVLETTAPEYIHNSVGYVSHKSDLRFIKTHMPFALLPDQIQNGSKSPKIIYVIRDPKDVCVSYYHHGKLVNGWTPNMEDFCKVFMANKVVYGSFWKHVLGFWEQRELPNLLFISYEDMKRDLTSVVKKVANFLGNPVAEDRISGLCDHLSFESMSKNEAVNGEVYIRIRRAKKIIPEEGKLFRSGTVGKYKEELTPEIIDKLNVWSKAHISGTSFAQKYNYSL